MPTKISSNPETSDREIVISRVFDAPRELVWQAMTDQQHVVNWWGPRGFSMTIETMDVRPGGVWKHTLHGPDGANYPNKSIFKEVVKPERIVYSHGGGREGGPGASFVSTWTFEVVGDGKTKLTMRRVFASPEARDFVVKEFGAIEGGKQTLERLSEHLPAMICAPFVISREFAAPRELVWKAWTQVEHLKEWFGPKGFAIPVAKLDFRVGGYFHFCMKAADGNTMWGKFSYREIVQPTRLVWVNSFSDETGALVRPPFDDEWPKEILNTVTFADHAGKTTVTIQSVPINASEEERKTFDANRESMTQGWSGTLEKLNPVLAKA